MKSSNIWPPPGRQLAKQHLVALPDSEPDMVRVYTLSDLLIRTKDRRLVPLTPNAVQAQYLDILDDGAVDTDNGPTIEPTCTNAQCAYDSLPDGTRFRVIERPIHEAANPATAYQVTDASETKRLSTERDLYPTLWMRFDSNAPHNDLSTYTHLINYGRLLTLPHTAKSKIEVVVLVTPTNQPLKAHELPIVSRRA